jgi:hypothetical protein
VILVADQTPPEPESRWQYVGDWQGLREPVNRHTLAIALIAGPVIFGALSLRVLGADPSTLAWVSLFVAVPAAIGGWVHPPLRVLRPRCAVAGVVIAAGALAATYGYLMWRGREFEVRYGLEFILPLVIGGLPGVALYYALVRHHK